MSVAQIFDLGLGTPEAAPTAGYRRERRFLCQGEVRLFLGEAARPILAELVDVSNLGFRVAHNLPEIAPGRECRFQHKFFVGKAKVVWTHLVAGRLESGLLIMRG